jgi:hypothetical protein
MNKRIALVCALAIAAAALVSFIACSTPDADTNEFTPTAPVVPGTTAGATKDVTVTIPLAHIQEPQADSRDISAAASRPIANYYEIYFKSRVTGTIYSASVMKGADNLAISVPASAEGIKYDVLFLVGKKLNSGALYLASAFTNDDGSSGTTGVPIKTGITNLISLTLSWTDETYMATSVTHNVTVNGYGSFNHQVDNDGTFTPLFRVTGVGPLVKAGFALPTESTNTQFAVVGTPTELNADSVPWVMQTGTTPFNDARYWLEPVGAAAWTAPGPIAFDKVYADATGTPSILYFKAPEIDDIGTTITDSSNSYGRFYGKLDFRPFASTGATRWCIWSGYNYSNMQAAGDGGGAVLLVIGSPAYVPPAPASTGGTTEIDFN